MSLDHVVSQVRLVALEREERKERKVPRETEGTLVPQADRENVARLVLQDCRVRGLVLVG